MAKSTLVITAWDSDELVGLERILEDGIMCMFYDVGVKPDRRGKGIGRQIMQRLIDSIKDK